ncbi:hypothetical protein CJE50_24465 [Salmonella enterica]|nr:hypothetical protein [Salmonella enterica]
MSSEPGSSWRGRCGLRHHRTTRFRQWLRRLKQGLSTKQYRCSPLLRVWIPKANGGQRPLSIPTIKDRVVQTAVLLVINPVFDTYLPPRQYGFRSYIDAKIAICRVYFSICQRSR